MRIRRTIATVLSALAVTAAAVVANSTPAYAAPSGCPVNNLCFYQNENYGGRVHPIKLVDLQDGYASLGSDRNWAGSVYNHTNYSWDLQDWDYGLGGYCVGRTAPGRAYPSFGSRGNNATDIVTNPHRLHDPCG